jgi:WD40 repeat protein
MSGAEPGCGGKHIDAAVMSLKHPDTVLSVAVFGNSIVTGCQDHIIRVWDSISWTCLGELRGHRRAVLGVSALDGVLLSASSDACIRVWIDENAKMQNHHESSTSQHSVSCGLSPLAEIGLGAGIVFTVLAKDAAPIVRRADGGFTRQLLVFAGCQDTCVARLTLELSFPAARDTLMTPAPTVGPRHCSLRLIGAARFVGCTGFVYSALVSSTDAGRHFWESRPLMFAGSGDGIVRVWEALAEYGSDAVVAPRTTDSPASVAPIDGSLITITMPPSVVIQPIASLPAPALRPHSHGVDSTPDESLTHYRARAMSADQWDDQQLSAALDLRPIQVKAESRSGSLCGTVYAVTCSGRDLFAGSQASGVP